MSDIKELFNQSLKKWKLYDNTVCHVIAVLIKKTDFNNHNFYEFSKGFIFASINKQKEIAQLQEQVKVLLEAVERIRYWDSIDEPFSTEEAREAIKKYKGIGSGE